MQCPLVALWKHFTLSVMYLSMDGFLSWMDSSHTQLITVLTNLDFYVFVCLVLGIAPVLFPFLVLVNDIFLWDGGLARCPTPNLEGQGFFCYGVFPMCSYICCTRDSSLPPSLSYMYMYTVLPLQGHQMWQCDTICSQSSPFGGGRHFSALLRATL